MDKKPPTTHFFTCGAAEGSTPLNAFDGALLSARLGNATLVKVRAVVPPGCKLDEAANLPDGSPVPAAYAVITSDVPGEIISAGVAVAYPAAKGHVGLIMEYASPGHKEDIEGIVRRMAEEGMKRRDLAIRDIRSIAVQHKVERIGSAIAAVVLRGEE